MSNNLERPPSAGFNNEPVDAALLLEGAGIDQRYANIDFMARTVYPCVMDTFTDGELVIPHPPIENPKLRDQFGSTQFNQGNFGPYLRELIDGPDEKMRIEADKLVRQAAAVMATWVVAKRLPLPEMPTLAIDTMARVLRFNETKAVGLASEPRVVLDYGPGLQGRFHIHQQVFDQQNNIRPYAHLACGKGPFINTFLQHYWKEYAGLESAQKAVNTIYIGREDGMAAASTSFIHHRRRASAPVEIADVALASAIHTVDQIEIFTAIRNAFTLLRPEGVLLVSAPRASHAEKGSTSAEAMIETALDAGFVFHRAQFYDFATKGNDLSPQTSLTAILRK